MPSLMNRNPNLLIGADTVQLSQQGSELSYHSRAAVEKFKNALPANGQLSRSPRV
jgi:hypothetical protein